jgi:hypothetical protein
MPICPWCETEFPAGRGHASRKRFCTPEHRTLWHNNTIASRERKLKYEKARRQAGYIPQAERGLELPDLSAPLSTERINGIVLLSRARRFSGTENLQALICRRYGIKLTSPQKRRQSILERHGLRCSGAYV